jgi:hypothetical protein
MWCVVEIKGSIFIVNNIKIKIIAKSWTDTTRYWTLACSMRININGIFFAYFKIRIGAIA